MSESGDAVSAKSVSGASGVPWEVDEEGNAVGGIKGQMWRVEMATARSGGEHWVVGGVVVYACVIIDSAPVFRRWKGRRLWELREWVEGKGGVVKLCG